MATSQTNGTPADSVNGDGLHHKTSSNGNGVSASPASYDCIIVGAGFSGISALHRFRKLGLSAHIFEAGTDFGGVWYWNRYPGARVDSETPFYQLNIPEVYRTWNFSVRFPDHVELRKYFAHIDKTLNVRKDTSFNSKVVDAAWDDGAGRWTIKTASGDVASAKYLMLCSGLLHHTYIPDFPGLSEYKGVVHHTGAWPEGVSVKGKKVAVVGAGATSVQVVQELGKEAEHLTMFMRRPSYCLPMGQREFTVQEQNGWRPYYDRLFKEGRLSFSGFPSTRKQGNLFDDSLEEREALFNELWDRGAFNYMMGNYGSFLIDKEANRVVYDFWKKKIRARMTDPKKQELMAPEEPPYYFATKRNPLEKDYYEILDQPNVEIVDLTKAPLKSFTETGLELEDGSTHDFDCVVLATGFDSFTGSMSNMGLKSKDGVDIKDIWSKGMSTYLGLLIGGFPNAFMVYSPQSPTALSNGITIIECQCDVVTEIISRLEETGAKSIEAKLEAQEDWKAALNAMNKLTLYPFTSSWWDGGNIPGKKAENMNYVGGIERYEKTCREMIDGWTGFNVVKA
ncbi:FAD/NAD(P)-binding domain-containing protein [Lophium mytilinum]|uniref:FAD/NAD(P)-binding domain-containing protein n=1 Tax=Lophium mytilinum TaxID=390894 RepID=A0A6A6QED6_9PEZI|nr:FAD/NAD(P)-binding domain-containing protein [Lophium mytilinum]